MTDNITQGQCFALNKLLEPYAAKDRAMRLYIVSKLIGREVASTTQLTRQEWLSIRNQAWYYDPDDGGGGNWIERREFGGKLAGLAEEYREQVLGQGRLF
jgi:hypothetical protein